MSGTEFVTNANIETPKTNAACKDRNTMVTVKAKGSPVGVYMLDVIVAVGLTVGLTICKRRKNGLATGVGTISRV